MPKLNFSLVALYAALAMTNVRAQAVPEFRSYAYGETYDDTHCFTLVAAATADVWFHYSYSGSMPSLAPPGAIRLTTIERNPSPSSAEAIFIDIEDGRKAIEVSGYPYFYITNEELDQILKSDSIVIRIKSNAEDNQPESWREERVNQDALGNLQRLKSLSILRTDQPLPWLAKGSLGVIIDTSINMKAYVDKVKTLVLSRFVGKSEKYWKFSLHLSDENGRKRLPQFKGSATFQPDERKHRAYAAIEDWGDAVESVNGVYAGPIDQDLLENYVKSVATQDNFSAVYFTCQTNEIPNVENTVHILHQRSMRFHVVWFGELDEKSERVKSLRQIVELSQGIFFTELAQIRRK